MTAALASSTAKAFQDVKIRKLAAVLNKIYSAVHYCRISDSHQLEEASRGSLPQPLLKAGPVSAGCSAELQNLQGWRFNSLSGLQQSAPLFDHSHNENSFPYI